MQSTPGCPLNTKRLSPGRSEQAGTHLKNLYLVDCVATSPDCGLAVPLHPALPMRITTGRVAAFIYTKERRLIGRSRNCAEKPFFESKFATRFTRRGHFEDDGGKQKRPSPPKNLLTAGTIPRKPHLLNVFQAGRTASPGITALRLTRKQTPVFMARIKREERRLIGESRKFTENPFFYVFRRTH